MNRAAGRLSVIVPVHNEEACLPALHARLAPSLDAAAAAAEVIFVDDASTDGSFAAIRALAAADRRVRGLRLEVNVGSQVAALAGLAAARGDALVTMDADLQHPPELLAEMVAAWRDGFDVVQMMRRRSPSQGLLRDGATRAFYGLFRAATGVELGPESTDYRLVDRACAQALLDMPAHASFVRAMVSRLGARATVIRFDVAPRFAGASAQTWPRLFSTALAALASFSRVPLPARLRPPRAVARVVEELGQGLPR